MQQCNKWASHEGSLTWTFPSVEKNHDGFGKKTDGLATGITRPKDSAGSAYNV